MSGMFKRVIYLRVSNDRVCKRQAIEVLLIVVSKIVLHFGRCLHTI